MKVQYSLFCLGYDESKGAPTFQFVVHELPLGPYPHTFPDGSGLFWVNGLSEVSAISRLRLKMSAPGGQALFEQALPVQPEEGGNRVLSVAFLEGLTFPSAGTYVAEVWDESGLLAQHTLEAIEVEIQ